MGLQEISGSSTSMMEEKTMDIKDIFARHGFRLCPLTNADANKLKLDFDELRDSVASQSVAVAGDGGGSVLCMTLCAGKIQQNVDLISSGAKKPKVLCGGPTSSGDSKNPFTQFSFECGTRRKSKVIAMRRFKSLHRAVLLPLVLCHGSSWVLVSVFHFLSFSWVLCHLASFLFVLAEFPVFLDHCTTVSFVSKFHGCIRSNGPQVIYSTSSQI